MNAFFMIVQRDLLLVMRRKSEVLTALFFFVIVTSLFPLGIGADTALLRKIAPGVIWVSALLATLLGLQRLFASDYQDGTLEQLALSPRSFVVLVLGKITAHWLVCGLPLLILAPVIGLQFDLDTASLKTLLLTLLLGTPVLSLIGSIGAALTLGLRGGGALMSLLVLPLYIPVLIFGAGAVYAKSVGLDVTGHFSLLGALLVLALAFMPWVSAAALRIAIE
ncbi:heme exporter protein CcmB [Polynucleobacter paneuropaeus]|jgi:heme exporter protein B|uniref:Heme exporter protein B n=1 Tax=Polynucleobacter paneuropaeus TaxID=2527775 RepID=A0A2Z4JR20_9BURK|nr:heme exporter protein CcmB [Polynucleobacter paneuropaeus]AWW49278.1 heme exporter protein CcmB [Polynucleobacter paneuropaeus]MBT8514692.1 heme exporter protein CcmB [Polynucleobacter paneuropaeus]MBT8535953.1 heme exporter protein CcmB [Polynucleobacter paneuropaeus]MBT8546015.1 heme exporter protein CcmB [Polynucleobacter paneuropaeus]MBT8553385.1 heme exporter protein CcmB [Polynucleobacter paneuropaeus]